MQNGEHEAGFTLHKINANWDSGDIIDQSVETLDYSLSVIENMCQHANEASQILIKLLEKMHRENPIHCRIQNEDDACYFSHANSQNLLELEKKNIRLIRPRVFIEEFVKPLFSFEPNEWDQLIKLTPLYA